jgi:nucleoside-diphosphate-sugar epimerase
VLDPDELGRLLGARPVPVPGGALRGGAWAAWTARLTPTSPGWIDMALGVPVMSTARARAELGWVPRRRSGEALLELLDGLRAGAGAPLPPLDPDTGRRFRAREVLTGVGGRP